MNVEYDGVKNKTAFASLMCITKEAPFVIDM